MIEVTSAAAAVVVSIANVVVVSAAVVVALSVVVAVIILIVVVEIGFGCGKLPGDVPFACGLPFTGKPKPGSKRRTPCKWAENSRCLCCCSSANQSTYLFESPP